MTKPVKPTHPSYHKLQVYLPFDDPIGPLDLSPNGAEITATGYGSYKNSWKQSPVVFGSKKKNLNIFIFQIKFDLFFKYIRESTNILPI